MLNLPDGARIGLGSQLLAIPNTCLTCLQQSLSRSLQLTPKVDSQVSAEVYNGFSKSNRRLESDEMLFRLRHVHGGPEIIRAVPVLECSPNKSVGKIQTESVSNDTPKNTHTFGRISHLRNRQHNCFVADLMYVASGFLPYILRLVT